jgi:hypothetical protein
MIRWPDCKSSSNFFVSYTSKKRTRGEKQCNVLAYTTQEILLGHYCRPYTGCVTPVYIEIDGVAQFDCQPIDIRDPARINVWLYSETRRQV